MNIRLATPDDFAAIDAFDPFAGDRQLEIREGRMIVIHDGADAAEGYLSWRPAGFVGRDYITFLGVAPDKRRRGHARALLVRALDLLAPGRVFISTEDNNAAMLALLEKDRWQPAGSVTGANEDGVAEVFFFKDVPA